jgi:predicted RNase H-like nuclease (RuvC/YqgF family)
MKPPKHSSQPTPEENQEADFVKELEDVERSLVSLRERYNQIQRDQKQQAQWQQRRQELQQNKHQTPQIKAELQHIKQQLAALEVNLESQLFSWRSLKKPFWQIVRFGGLGVIIGWILKSFVG